MAPKKSKRKDNSKSAHTRTQTKIKNKCPICQKLFYSLQHHMRQSSCGNDLNTVEDHSHLAKLKHSHLKTSSFFSSSSTTNKQNQSVNLSTYDISYSHDIDASLFEIQTDDNNIYQNPNNESSTRTPHVAESRNNINRSVPHTSSSSNNNYHSNTNTAFPSNKQSHPSTTTSRN